MSTKFEGASQVSLGIKNPPANVGDIRDLGSIPELGRSPGGGHGNPLQCSCLENPHGQRSPVGYSPWGCKESDTTEETAHTHTHTHAPNLRTHISLGPDNPFLGIYLIQMLIKCTEIIAVMLVIRKDQKHQYKKNIWHIHTMECYITSKIRDEMTFGTQLSRS